MTPYRSFGMLGMVVLLFGLGAWLVTFEFSAYVLAHVIVGGAMVALYLFTHIESLRESMTGRQAKYGTNTVIYSLMTIGVIGITNYLGVQHPLRYDTTSTGVFSLAPQTRQLLNNLQDDVSVSAYYRSGEEAAALDLLETYAFESDRFTFEMIDPNMRPELAAQQEVTQYGTFVVVAGNETTRLTETTEEALTNALIRITNVGRKVGYYLTGHGEPELEEAETPNGYGQLKSALENEGYDVVPLLLGGFPDVPADANLLIIAGPQRPLLEGELQAVDRYIDRGGRALIMIEPQQSPDLVQLLGTRGIEVGNDVVIEQYIQLLSGPTLGVQPIIGDYGFHAITEGFRQRTVYQLARTVDSAEETPDGVTISQLTRTSDNSWGETDLERLMGSGEVSLDDSDVEGPVSLSVAATLTGDALNWTAPLIASTRPPDEEGSEEDSDNSDTDLAATAVAQSATEQPADLEGRIVVVGDAEWTNNSYLSLYFNEDFALNAVSWLAGKEELISIRPRTIRSSRLVLTAGQGQTLFYAGVLLLPELILFAGLITWYRRRR